MSESRNWAMVKVDLHNDRRIQEIACEFGPRALAYWLVLILESKKVHRSNDGWAGPWTWQQLACMCYDEKAKRKTVEELVSVFVDSGLLDIDNSALGSRKVSANSALGRFYTRPSKFLAIQKRGSRADTEARSKRKMQEKNTKQQPFTEEKSSKKTPEEVAYTYTNTYTDKLVSKDTCQNDDFDLSNTDEKIVSFRASVADVEKPSKISNDDVLDVFQYWVEQDTRTGGTTLAKKLTNDRRQKIRARLKEGYEVEQLKQAIDYYLSQPFYLGENDRSKRYTDLTTIFRTGSKVEEGLQAAPVKSVKRTLSLEELEADVLAEFEARRNGGVR